MADANDEGRGGIRYSWWILALIVPIGLFGITQLSVVQNAEGYLFEGMPKSFDLGKWDVIADILAPIWVVSIIVFGTLGRQLLGVYAPDPEFRPKTWFGRRFANETWVLRSTWIATWGAVLIVLMSWTREWARFREQPRAFWYVLVILLTLLFALVPLWWLRHDLHAAARRAVTESRTGRTVARYLFDDGGSSRWVQAAVLAALTALAGFIVTGQLDTLLGGMRTADAAGGGLGSLSRVLELNLTFKPDQVVELVGTWREYSSLVGPVFADAREVIGAHIVVDSLMLIPGYGALLAVLLLHFGRDVPEGLEGKPRRSYDLIVSAGLGVLLVTVLADYAQNLMVWIVVNQAWVGLPSAASVRQLWFATALHTLGLWLLVAVGVLLLALRRRRMVGAAYSLVAIRSEVLVLGLTALVLFSMQQTADAMRRWTVSVTLVSVGVAIALAMVLQWTSRRALGDLRANALRRERGEEIEPGMVTPPWASRPVLLRRLVIAGLFAAAALQVLLTAAFGLPLGLGLVVPCVLIALIWVFGIPLPEAGFDRGDRRIAVQTLDVLPALLGSLVLAVLGAAVLRAAVPQLIFARHADWWLLFALLPMGVGIYRLHTRTARTMGRIELAVTAGVVLVGAILLGRGNPELSAVALSFTGVMLLYGSMPFFYSYGSESGPSRFARRHMRVALQPILALGLVAALTVAGLLVVFPLEMGGHVGMIAVLLLAAMIFAMLGSALVRFAERTEPAKLFFAFRLRRTPVFAFLGAWLLFAGVAATAASNDIPVVEAAPGSAGARSGIDVDDVWHRWLDRNIDPVGGEGARTAVPLVLVAVSGGGIRAAVWSAYVLDCLFGATDIEGCVEARGGLEPVLAMSGVSGGSVGIAAYQAHALGAPDAADWVSARLGDDYLAAAMSWLAFVDTPRSFLGFGPRIRDRAELMALALERSWSDEGDDALLRRGVFELWDTEPSLPLTIFNGSSVNDPCRFNLSVLDANAHPIGDTCTSLDIFTASPGSVPTSASFAATQDLADYLCPGEDIRVSTAALMSARFPVVNASARIGETLAQCGRPGHIAYVVDGGYYDPSGASSLFELWNALEPRVNAWNADADAETCIVPFFIQIDNGYENPSGSASGSKPFEVMVPLSVLLEAQSSRMANARELAAITFDSSLITPEGALEVFAGDAPVASRYARLTTRAHPGIQAPLGWTLSLASIDDLRNQLSIDENQRQLREISEWLSGDLWCK